MSKYLFIYHGGKAPDTDEEHTKVMDAWGQWLGSMGTAVIDGGNPVGQSTTINSNRKVESNGGTNPVSGYSLIEASDIEDAIAKGKQCPIFESGGSIELAEAFDM